MLKKNISLSVLLLILLSGISQAEQSQNFGDYTIHYVVVNSTFIDPDIALQYNILRSDRRAFLNVSVLKNTRTGKTIPVTANISGGKRNLLGQAKDLNFVKVTEGDAIYYLGQFEFSNAENTRFSIEVQPEGEGRSYSLKWSTVLYNN